MLNNEGVRNKPKGCNLCPSHYLGTGFCPDYVPEHPKMMLILESPTSDDVVNQSPLSGIMGDFLDYKVFKPLQIKREDLIICNVLRCKAPYPIGKIKGQSENACRQYDSAIKHFDPNLFLMTFSIADTYKDPAYLSLLIEDLRRAKRLLVEYPDNRLAVLMGENAIQMVNNLPFRTGKGGLRQWRGQFWEGKWNFGKDN